ncbi:MAG: hypothetical protein LBF26_00920 [Puniceicoccales bacterium]|jgi:hypothetical protein|nr:hypothetical protein [Puniceicoccales bacterium]
MSLALLGERGIVATLEQRGADCKMLFAAVQRLDSVTQEELVRTCATVAVREWGKGTQLRNALVQLAIDGEFAQYSWLVGVFLRHTNTAMEVYNSENVALQVANDHRLAGEAYDRAGLNVRVGGGVFAGSLSGGALGSVVGIAGGPVGIAFGIGLGALFGGGAGGLVANATATKK